MSFSIRLSKEEKRLAQSYADIHGISVARAFKDALFERIEDEYDLSIIEQVESEFAANPVTYSMEEVRKMLDEI